MKMLKKHLRIVVLLVGLMLLGLTLDAQCSICTKNAQQLGDKAAKGLNLSILFLAFTPLALMAFIGYKWWKNEQKANAGIPVEE
jgi:uncharacterized membrane protein (Fun14 family)